MRRSALVLCALLLCLSTPARAQGPVDSRSAPCPAALGPTHEPPAWTAFRCAWANVGGYSTTVTMTEHLGDAIQTSVSTFTFHKPSSAVIHFIAGKNSGVTIEWSGGDTVVAHRGSGLMGLFKKTFALHDPQMMTIRGASIDELSFGAILAHAQDIAGTISQTPGPTLFGGPTDTVALVPTSSASDSGLTREVAVIATEVGFPLRLLCYEGDSLVRQIDFTDLKLLPS